MKTYLILLCCIVTGIFTACQQNNDPNITPNDYYITLDLDGTLLLRYFITTQLISKKYIFTL
jgi:hypothetical protein